MTAKKSTDKPLVYVASPYTKGDVSLNVNFQLRMFNELLDDEKVWPIVPLWTHFQHLMFPREYDEWMRYDSAILSRCDAVLRLSVVSPIGLYVQMESYGADAEVTQAREERTPVFYDKARLYDWVRGRNRE